MAYYHYCSTEAFCQIFTHKTVWLSSLKSSNDAMEGKWTVSVIQQVAAEIGVPAAYLAEFANTVGMVDDMLDCLGFCMSGGGDILSQWRGYADDGRGVCIGFSEEFIGRLIEQNQRVRLHQVVYNFGEQKKVVATAVQEAKRLIEEGALSPVYPGTELSPKSADEITAEQSKKQSLFGALFNCILQLERPWYSLKNPAFAEENEVRLARTITSLDTTEYRTANGRLVQYVSLPFPAMPDFEPVIQEIIVGPKNPTPLQVFNRFLARSAWDDVAVSPSTASYR